MWTGRGTLRAAVAVAVMLMVVGGDGQGVLWLGEVCGVEHRLPQLCPEGSSCMTVEGTEEQRCLLEGGVLGEGALCRWEGEDVSRFCPEGTECVGLEGEQEGARCVRVGPPVGAPQLRTLGVWEVCSGVGVECAEGLECAEGSGAFEGEMVCIPVTPSTTSPSGTPTPAPPVPLEPWAVCSDSEVDLCPEGTRCLGGFGENPEVKVCVPTTEAPVTTSPPTTAPRTPSPTSPSPAPTPAPTPVPPTPSPTPAPTPSPTPSPTRGTTPVPGVVVGGGCETAFGMGAEGRCFIDLGMGIARWGWTNVVRGDTTLVMHAGAGQCNTGKGYESGTVDVRFEDGGVRVRFAPHAGVAYTETHLYVGGELLPRGRNGRYTVAPGQYPQKGKGEEYFVRGVTAPVYVVAHAVACGRRGTQPQPPTPPTPVAPTQPTAAPGLREGDPCRVGVETPACPAGTTCRADGGGVGVCRREEVGGCLATCFGFTCTFWNEKFGRQFEDLEAYGCDCSGCAGTESGWKPGNGNGKGKGKGRGRGRGRWFAAGRPGEEGGDGATGGMSPAAVAGVAGAGFVAGVGVLGLVMWARRRGPAAREDEPEEAERPRDSTIRTAEHYQSL